MIQKNLDAEGITEKRTMLVSADMGKEEEVTAMFEAYFANWEKLDVVSLPFARARRECRCVSSVVSSVYLWVIVIILPWGGSAEWAR